MSVLMPCLNPGPYLPAALETLRSQSFQDWELIVQDAGSTDGSREFLEQLASEDARLHVVVEPDDGQSDALNRALHLARGVVVGWLNADDVLEAGALEAVAEAVNRTAGESVVYGDWGIVDAEGSPIRAYHVREWSIDRFFSHGCYIFSGAIFWPRDPLQRSGGWNASLHYCMDLDLVLRLGDCPAVHAGRQLAALRWHVAAKSSQASAGFLRESARVRLAAARTWRDRVTTLRATMVALMSMWTSTIRFGKRYSALRPTKQV